MGHPECRHHGLQPLSSRGIVEVIRSHSGQPILTYCTVYSTVHLGLYNSSAAGISWRSSVRIQVSNRRRIQTEAKARVVASAWGAEFFNSWPHQLFCPRTILEKRMTSSFSLNHPSAIHTFLQIVQCKIGSAARN